jgi:hypothetical protein
MLKFGVEMEYKGDPAKVATAMRQSGLLFIDARREYMGFSETHWMLKRDGSVSNGGELVSPPLDFDNPENREQVNIAVRAMQEAGCEPESGAGIHVHVEAKHEDGRVFTARELAASIRFFHKFQDLIYRIASSGWTKIGTRADSYCKPISEDLATRMMKVRSEEALRRLWYRESHDYQNDHYNSTRYRGINLHSFFQGPGTIELRVFNSSMNPDRVQAYIALSCAIIRDVRNGYNRSVKKSYKLGGMATGETDEDKAMLRFQQVMCYEAGMSKEDWKNLRKTCWNDSVPQRASIASSY